MSKIVILAGKDISTNIIYNALKDEFNIDRVIIENPVPRSRFLKNRIKRLGILTVIGQILFMMIIVPILEITSKRRKSEICSQFEMNLSPIDPTKVLHVESVNLEQSLSTLSKINPSVVIINGTRILSKKILQSINAEFINMHAGITPQYRGVHGGYWALVDRSPDLCGVTIHLVDPGIDTGGILKQGIISPSSNDNYVTYPLLQIGTGIPLLIKSVTEILEAQFSPTSTQNGESKLWSHPTLWQYIWNRFTKGVK